MKYYIIQHHNSNRAKKRGLWKWGQRFVSIQVVRGGDTELLKGVNPAVARYMGGRYQVPFVGLKQQRKMEGLVA